MTAPGIAVIDDSRDIRELLADILTAEGYEVTTFAGDEKDLVRALVAARPLVIVMDLLIGDDARSGWDLLRTLRRAEHMHDVPILVCSADIRALRERRSHFAADPKLSALEKPFTVETFERSVAELVAGQALPTWNDEADVVLIADADSNLVHGSKAALAHLGASLAELRRLRVADIVADDRAWTEREWNRYLRDKAWEGPVRLRTRDGRELPARSKAEIVQAGSTIWHVSRLTLQADHVSDEPAIQRSA